MDKYVEYCKQHCKKRDITIEEILTDTKKCNFCDIAYHIIKMREDNDEK